MINIIKYILNLKSIALDGNAKVGSYYQHRLLPLHNHENNILRNCSFKVYKKLGIIICSFNKQGYDIGHLEYDLVNKDKFKLLYMVFKLPGDIHASYRKNNDGSYKSYISQIDLIYKREDYDDDYLVVKIPVEIDNKHEINSSAVKSLKYQKFFYKLSNQISNSIDGDFDIGIDNFVLNDMFPINSVNDKKHLVFFVNKYDKVDKINLNIITFKNSLKIDCKNTINNFMKYIYNIIDINCYDIYNNKKLKNILNISSKNFINPSSDIYSIELKMSSKQINDLSKNNNKKEEFSIKTLDGDADILSSDVDDKVEDDNDNDNKDEDNKDSKDEDVVNVKDEDVVKDEKNVYSASGIIVFNIVIIVSIILVFMYVLIVVYNGNIYSMFADIRTSVLTFLGFGISAKSSILGLQIMQDKKKDSTPFETLYKNKNDKNDKIIGKTGMFANKLGMTLADQNKQKKIENKKLEISEALDDVKDIIKLFKTNSKKKF